MSVSITHNKAFPAKTKTPRKFSKIKQGDWFFCSNAPGNPKSLLVKINDTQAVKLNNGVVWDLQLDEIVHPLWRVIAHVWSKKAD